MNRQRDTRRLYRIRLLAALTTSFLPWAAGAAWGAGAQSVSFVACPILRDVPERLRLSSQVPCWMARYGGKLYYLGRQEDTGDPFSPPQLKHQVLVEGVVDADAPRICGGIPVKPLKIAILQEIDARCQEILPADGFAAPAGYHDATPKPGVPKKLKLTGLQPGPDGVYRILVPFTFGRDSIQLFSYFGVEAFADLLSHGQYTIRLVSITTPALLSDGTVLQERADITVARANSIIEAIHIMGRNIDPSIRTESREPSADGMVNAAGRYVTIEVTPNQDPSSAENRRDER